MLNLHESTMYKTNITTWIQKPRISGGEPPENIEISYPEGSSSSYSKHRVLSSQKEIWLPRNIKCLNEISLLVDKFESYMIVQSYITNIPNHKNNPRFSSLQKLKISFAIRLWKFFWIC
jgi:hypothetical protein